MSGMQQSSIGESRTPVSRRLGVYAVGIAIGLMVVGFANQRRQAGTQPPATPDDEATQSARLAERLQGLQTPPEPQTDSQADSQPAPQADPAPQR